MKLTIAYDGTDFHGWQTQPQARTVQGCLEAALAALLGEKVSVVAAGRTDAGVHSLGQIAHTDIHNQNITPEQISKGLNRLLAPDVRILRSTEASSTFHARFSALDRRYRYNLRRFDNPLERCFSWRPHCRWDDDIIVRAVDWLIGEHSFKSFCRPRPGETDYRCRVNLAEWTTDGSRAWLDIRADRFFHQMIRGVVGALIDLGRGYLHEPDFRALIEQPQETAQVRFAPARGLTLMEVRYY